jgi:hypothetical protein
MDRGLTVKFVKPSVCFKEWATAMPEGPAPMMMILGIMATDVCAYLKCSVLFSDAVRASQ